MMTHPMSRAVLCVTFLFCGLISATAEELPMVRHTLLGDSLATRGLVDGALAEYESALAAGAGSARFLNRMGELYLRNEQFTKATDTFQRSLREQPGQLRVYSKLGEAYLAQSRLDSAIHYVEQALLLAPNATMVRSSLGGLYLKAGELKRAKAHLDTALLIDPANPEAHRFFGFYYTEQDSFSMARRHFESIIESFPDALEAYNNIAFLYAQEREYGLALEFYGRAKDRASNAMEMHTLNLQIEAVRAIMDGKMRARYILVKTEAEARDLRIRLESGDDFATMAQQFSAAANAPYGGDTDFFGSGDLLPQFEEVVLGLAVGAVSEVVEVPLGFIIVQRTN
jgi:tetratricopeptide (TPR) repeat protein